MVCCFDLAFELILRQMDIPVISKRVDTRFMFCFVLFCNCFVVHSEQDLTTIESTQESDSSGNNGIFNFGLNVVYFVLIVTVGGVICIVVPIAFCASIFYKWKNQQQELELRRIQSEQSAQRNANNIRNGKVRNRNIQLGPIPTNVNMMMADKNNESKVNDIDNAVKSEKKQNNSENKPKINNVNGGDEGKINTDRFTDSDESDEDCLQIEYKLKSVSSSLGFESGTISDKSNCDIILSEHNENHDTLDVTDYKTWNQEQVLAWIKMNLVNNGLGNDQIDHFLKEFKTKSITGKMLSYFQQQLNAGNKNEWNEFRADFSNDNQTFGIWLVIQNAIKAIEMDVNTKGGEA